MVIGIAAAAVLVLAVVELVGRATVADGVVDDARAATGAAEGSANIPTWPLVPQVLLTGRVPELELSLREVPGPHYPISAYRASAVDLVAGRGALTGEPDPVSVDAVRVTVGLDSEDLSAALGFPVIVRTSRVEVRAGDGPVATATVAVRDDHLVLESSGFGEYEVPLPPRELLPCEPVARARDELLELTCRADRWPSGLAS